MTSINAPHDCDRCGGKLVPPELLLPSEPATERKDDPPDYVCFVCRRKFRWEQNPPRLKVVP
jgi:hypothetical protein